jgi:serine/threonine protein kinase
MNQEACVLLGQTCSVRELFDCLAVIDRPMFRLSDLAVDLTDYHYDQNTLLGSGSFGDAYRARHKTTGEEFAIKILRNPLQSCHQRTFLRELEILMANRHPGALFLVGFALSAGPETGPALVTPLMEPVTLELMIRSDCSGHPSPGWTATAKSKCVIGVAAAMEYMHSLGLMHRDLKPANIFLDAAFCPVIADFGLSTSSVDSGASEDGSGSVTHTEGVGTPLYMAPEVFVPGPDSEIEYDLPVDVYSYAMTLYMMFCRNEYPTLSTGQVANSSRVLYAAVARGKRYKKLPEIPEFYWNLIGRCWAHEPESRPTFSQIVDELLANRGFVFEGTDEAELGEYEAMLMSFRPNPQGHSASNRVDRPAASRPATRRRISRFDRLIVDPSVIDCADALRQALDYVVYNGVDRSRGERIAVFAQRTPLSAANQEQFLRALQLWSRVQAPSVLPLLRFSFARAAGLAERGPFVITPTVQRETLEDVLRAARRGEAPEFWTGTAQTKFVFGIAAALAVFHESGIIYRGLTPRKVSIDAAFEPVIGLVDTRDDLLRPSDAKEADACSAMVYVAPEILQDSDGSYDRQADVYSYAILLYVMFAESDKLKMGDRGDAESDLKSRILAGERYADLRSIPRAYWNLIQRCWNGNPAERPGFSDIVEELRNNPTFALPGADMENVIEYQNKVSKKAS